jgi:hypothetical protein
MLVVLSWCTRKRVLLFVSIFNPLMVVVVVVFSSLLLGEKLYPGSVLGAEFIVMGLYSVRHLLAFVRCLSVIMPTVPVPDTRASSTPRPSLPPTLCRMTPPRMSRRARCPSGVPRGVPAGALNGVVGIHNYADIVATPVGEQHQPY